MLKQYPATGTPTYFLPLKAGSRKKWGSKTRDFWCCHGTMVQAQTLYPELIYFRNDASDSILVSQYISSTLKCRFKDSDISIEQTTDMKSCNSQVFFDECSGGDMSRWSFKFDISSSEPKEFILSLRIPCWIKGEPIVTLNGQKPENTNVENGWLNIKKQWSSDTLQILFLSGVVMEALPDRSDLSSSVDGPIVLAGLTDSDCGLIGDFDDPDTFMYPQAEHIYDTYPWKQNCYVTKHQPKNFPFQAAL